MSFYRDVESVIHAYVRKGGKDNRRQQARRMLSFASHCQNLGVRHAGEVGRRHVIEYWKSLRVDALSERTIYSHYLALRELWKLLRRLDLPPMPKHMIEADAARGTSKGSDANPSAQ